MEIVKGLVGLRLIFIFSILVAFPVMWLWDWLIPNILGLTTITIWESLGLCVLSNVLLKSNKE